MVVVVVSEGGQCIKVVVKENTKALVGEVNKWSIKADTLSGLEGTGVP